MQMTQIFLSGAALVAALTVVGAVARRVCEAGGGDGARGGEGVGWAGAAPVAAGRFGAGAEGAAVATGRSVLFVGGEVGDAGAVEFVITLGE